MRKMRRRRKGRRCRPLPPRSTTPTTTIRGRPCPSPTTCSTIPCSSSRATWPPRTARGSINGRRGCFRPGSTVSIRHYSSQVRGGNHKHNVRTFKCVQLTKIFYYLYYYYFTVFVQGSFVFNAVQYTSNSICKPIKRQMDW